MSQLYNWKDVQQLLDIGSQRTAQMRIKALNDELKEKGFWVEPGKVPKKYFHERYCYIDPISN